MYLARRSKRNRRTITKNPIELPVKIEFIAFDGLIKYELKDRATNTKKYI